MQVQVKKVNKLIQPRIMGIVGSMGAGKTLYASAIAERLKYHYTIMANYDLKCRDMDITPENIASLMFETRTIEGKKLLIIDEFHIFSDSRLSSSNHNILMSYFITQTRKQNVQLIYTTQQLGQVDIRVRDNTDVLALPVYDVKTDIMTVIFLKRDWLTSQFKFSHLKKYTNLSPVFERYTTEQLIGETMIKRIQEKEKEKSNKKSNKKS